MISTSEYVNLDGLGMAELVKNGEVTPSELLETAVSLIKALDPQINAIVTPMFEEAKTAVSAGLPDGPFQGVPFFVKDLGEMIEGVRSTGGSRALANFVTEIDSEFVKRLRKSGLILTGKTNTPEFGLLPTTESELLGPCRNPWNLDRSTGGSSGGAAAAVAAGFGPIAHATDGGGSIRIPASCCGLFGMKPTRGRTPQGPIRGDSMNGLSIGNAVSRTVRDSAALLDALAGPDIGDPYWAPPMERPYLEELNLPPGQLRIAVLTKALNGAQIDEDVVQGIMATATLCETLGHEVDVVETLPGIDIEQFIKAFTAVWVSGCAWSVKGIEILSKSPARPEIYEPLTWQMYQMSLQMTPADYLLAVQSLQQTARRVAHFFQTYDMLLTPVTAQAPPLLGTFDCTSENPLAGFHKAIDYVPFTPIANVTGQPAMSVPLTWNAEGLPIGSHFMGRFGEEGTLFRLAAQLEEAQPWAHRKSPLLSGYLESLG